jgi:hypothetical protein
MVRATPAADQISSQKTDGSGRLRARIRLRTLTTSMTAVNPSATI